MVWKIFLILLYIIQVCYTNIPISVHTYIKREKLYDRTGGDTSSSTISPQIYTYIHSYIHIYRQTERQTDRQKDRQKGIYLTTRHVKMRYISIFTDMLNLYVVTFRYKKAYKVTVYIDIHMCMRYYYVKGNKQSKLQIIILPTMNLN